MRLARVVFGRACVLALTLACSAAVAAAATPDRAAPADLAEGFAPPAAHVRHFRAAPAATSLHLDEMLPGPARDWDGSGTFSSRDDEWVELVTDGAAPLDLTGFFVTDGDTLPRYALSGTLAPGEHLLVTGKQSFDWEKANGYPSFGLSLGNSGDAVMLWQATGGDTALVEQYAYSSHEAAADRSIGRLPDGSGDWALFDSLDPYTGTVAPTGTGCAPTPGADNVCGTTDVRRAHWGRVKALYR